MIEVFNTNNYRRVVLNETKKTQIVFTQCKSDSKLDRIYFIKLGSVEMNIDPEIISVYRYEDEQLIESMLQTFHYEG